MSVDHQPRSAVAAQRDFELCNFRQVDRRFAGHREGACRAAVRKLQATVGKRIATETQRAGIDRHVEGDQLAVRDNQTFGAVPAELNIHIRQQRGGHACRAPHRESPGRITDPPDGFRELRIVNTHVLNRELREADRPV